MPVPCWTAEPPFPPRTPLIAPAVVIANATLSVFGFGAPTVPTIVRNFGSAEYPEVEFAFCDRCERWARLFARLNVTGKFNGEFVNTSVIEIVPCVVA